MIDTEKLERRQELYSLLGELPPRERAVSARKISEENCGSYILERLVLDLNGVEQVPAVFTKPAGLKGKLPVILYNHAHGGDYVLGKEELIKGRGLLYKVPYAEELAKLGFAALCIDTWAFGERRGRSESSIFKHMLWHGRVLWGMMVYDSLKALDYLVSRDDVDVGRIGTLGLSMGSTMAWWTAALDTRIKVCVDICCLTDYAALIEQGGLDRHGLYYYVPGLLKHFTAAQINALIAPRPHLSLAGNYDPLTPAEGLDRIDEELGKVYAEEGNEQAWVLKRYEIEHFETAEMREEIKNFLKSWF